MKRSLRWRWVLIALTVLGLTTVLIMGATRLNLNPWRTVGEVMDEFNGIPVYYNGGVQHTEGRHLAPDGYNLGLRYQCVEFIKRYYHQRLQHAMPDTMGHAKDFFDHRLKDGETNMARGLVQYLNGGASLPQAEDIIVFAPWVLNRYGHVAIVTRVDAETMEVIQQNPGPYGDARERFALTQVKGVWRVEHPRVWGWLRKGGTNG